MSVSAAHASEFYDESLREAAAWGVRGVDGFPAPRNSDGVRAMPFWSLRTRVERIIATVDAYAGLEPVEIPLQEFRDRWLPGLESDGLLVGLNWSGSRATGFDVTPADVAARFAAHEQPS